MDQTIVKSEEKKADEIRHISAQDVKVVEQKKEQARTTIKKALFLDYFRKTMGIVDAAAKGADIDRDIVYIWRKNDQAFALKMDQIINDEPNIAEQQLKSAILKGYMPSVHFYLSRRHPAYKQKIEHSGVVLNIYGQLTDEQKLERLRRSFAARGGGDGKAKLDLLDGGHIGISENGKNPSEGGGEATGGGESKAGDIPATEGSPENHGDNNIIRGPEVDSESESAGIDNQRETG